MKEQKDNKVERCYIDYEFCINITCGYLEHDENGAKCYWDSPVSCCMTAREFHRWLKNNRFKVVKDG